MGKRIGLAVAAAITILYLYFQRSALKEFFTSTQWSAAWPWLLAALLLFLLLHLVKFLRYYLILSESKINLVRYFWLYLQTTLVNVLVPFKLGEVFRFFRVAKEAKSYRTSLLSILTERFFDTIVIVVILFAQAMLVRQLIDWPLLVLFLFVFVLFSIYIMYPSTTKYLNRYFVTKKPLSRDVVALRVLDNLDGWYAYEQRIVKGKGWLLLLLSVAAWVVEYFFLVAISNLTGMAFNFETFTHYIGGIIETSPDMPAYLLNIYCFICIFVFAVLYLIAAIAVRRSQKKQSNKGASRNE